MRLCTYSLDDFAGFAFAMCCGALLALVLTSDLHNRQERVIHAHR